jgi:hypothetical protein
MYPIADASIFGVLDYGGHLVEALLCRSCFSSLDTLGSHRWGSPRVNITERCFLGFLSCFLSLGVDTTARLMRGRMGFAFRVSGSELYPENYVKNGLGQLSRTRQTCEPNHSDSTRPNSRYLHSIIML